MPCMPHAVVCPLCHVSHGVYGLSQSNGLGLGLPTFYNHSYWTPTMQPRAAIMNTRLSRCAKPRWNRELARYSGIIKFFFSKVLLGYYLWFILRLTPKLLHKQIIDHSIKMKKKEVPLLGLSESGGKTEKARPGFHTRLIAAEGPPTPRGGRGAASEYPG